MNEDLYIKVDITKDEWDSHSLKEKNNIRAKLLASDIWIAQYIAECLQEYEKQLAKENKIDYERTYDLYYGDKK